MEFVKSDEYKGIVVVLFIVSILTWVVWEAALATPHFVYNVPQEEQPNCVVGAYIMYAKETLNVELLKGKIQEEYPILKNGAVEEGFIPAIWNNWFHTNQLKCIYNRINKDSFTYTGNLDLDKPFIWVGNWPTTNTNDVTGHTCLVYFKDTSVIFKHFVLDPTTKTNYMVQTNYEFFFDRTVKLYTLK